MRARRRWPAGSRDTSLRRSASRRSSGGARGGARRRRARRRREVNRRQHPVARNWNSCEVGVPGAVPSWTRVETSPFPVRQACCWKHSSCLPQAEQEEGSPGLLRCLEGQDVPRPPHGAHGPQHDGLSHAHLGSSRAPSHHGRTHAWRRDDDDDANDLLLWLQRCAVAVLWARHQHSWRNGRRVRRHLLPGPVLRGPEDRPREPPPEIAGQHPLQFHACPGTQRHRVDGDAQDGWATDAELPSPLPDGPARPPSGGQLFPDARLHDLQRLPLHRRGRRGGDGLLPLQLEEGGGGGHHGTLPLTPGRGCAPDRPPERTRLLRSMPRRSVRCSLQQPPGDNTCASHSSSPLPPHVITAFWGVGDESRQPTLAPYVERSASIIDTISGFDLIFIFVLDCAMKETSRQATADDGSASFFRVLFSSLRLDLAGAVTEWSY